MKRETLFIIIIMILGVGMVIRTFFGGNGDNGNIPDEKPGFIEETLNNTGTSQPNNQTNTGGTTGEINNEKIKAPTTPEYNEIKIMMPKYFYISTRKNLEEHLYNNQKIKVNYIFIDDLNSYRKNLSDPNFSEADIFLFPYDRKDIVKTRSFTFQNNIQGAFDELIQPLVKNNQIGFLPFAADPMVMYSSIDLKQNNFSEITDSIYERESNIQLAFPIFFGITKEDYDNKGFSREYKDIVRYALIHYFKKYQDSHSLEDWINSNILEGSNESRNYNVGNLNTLANAIAQPECKYFPSICFQVFNFVGIRFGFLSDKDIVRTYFSNRRSNFDELSRMTMPFFSTESPVRIRGWGISNNLQDTDTINNIYKFFVEYLSNHNNYNLRSSTLSVFKQEKNPLIDNKYIGLRGYILETGGDYIETLRSIKPFRELIEYQISANDFLKKVLK